VRSGRRAAGGIFLVNADIIHSQIGQAAHVILPAVESGEMNLRSMKGATGSDGVLEPVTRAQAMTRARKAPSRTAIVPGLPARLHARPFIG